MLSVLAHSSAHLFTVQCECTLFVDFFPALEEFFSGNFFFYSFRQNSSNAVALHDRWKRNRKVRNILYYIYFSVLVNLLNFISFTLGPFSFICIFFPFFLLGRVKMKNLVKLFNNARNVFVILFPSLAYFCFQEKAGVHLNNTYNRLSDSLSSTKQHTLFYTTFRADTSKQGKRTFFHATNEQKNNWKPLTQNHLVEKLFVAKMKKGKTSAQRQHIHATWQYKWFGKCRTH